MLLLYGSQFCAAAAGGKRRREVFPRPSLGRALQQRRRRRRRVGVAAGAVPAFERAVRAGGGERESSFDAQKPARRKIGEPLVLSLPHPGFSIFGPPRLARCESEQRLSDCNTEGLGKKCNNYHYWFCRIITGFAGCIYKFSFEKLLLKFNFLNSITPYSLLLIT